MSWAAIIPLLRRRFSSLAVEDMPDFGFTEKTFTQTAHGFAVQDLIYVSGAPWAKAQANADTTIATAIVTEVPTANSFAAVPFGLFLTLTAHGLGASGTVYYLSATVAGGMTTTAPVSPNYAQFAVQVIDADTLLVRSGEAVLLA